MRGPVSAPPAPTSATTAKAATDDAKALIDEVKQRTDAYTKELNDKQSAADKAANDSRMASFHDKVQVALYGDPDKPETKHESFMAIAEDMAGKAGGQQYENLKSGYQQIMRLMVALCAVLTALFRTEHRIAGGLAGIANIVGKVMNGIASLTGTAVELPEGIVHASRCDAQGKLTFDELSPTHFSKGMPTDIIKMVSKTNEFLVHGFLLEQGYEPDTNDVYSKMVGSNKEVLTPQKFESLKNDPSNGLKQFAVKHLPVKFSKSPIGPSAAHVAAPAPMSNTAPTPASTMPKPGFGS